VKKSLRQQGTENLVAAVAPINITPTVSTQKAITMAKFSFLLSALVACLVALSATAFAPMSK